MRSACLQAGQRLTLDRVEYEIVKITGDGIYQLEAQSDFRIINKPKVELLRASEDGLLKFPGTRNNLGAEKSKKLQPRDLSSYSEELQKVAKRRMDYICCARQHLGDKPTLDKLDRVIRRHAADTKDTESPAPITLYKWWREWVASGSDITALVPRSKRPGYITRKLSKQVVTYLNDIIHDDYLTKTAFTKQDVYERLLWVVSQYNKKNLRALSMPSRATVYRYFDKLDRYDLLEAKKGKRFAQQVFRQSGQGVCVSNILERVEADHTPLDLIVVDENHNPVGRPNLTCLIDKKSRMVLGYSLSFEPPSELSVIRCLRHALFPKQSLKEQYPDLENEWLAYGVPMALVVDNGLEFHSKMLRQLCYELNIELVFCPKQQPQFKGAVERFLGTLNRSVSHKCEGTTFSNINQRGDYQSAELARVTLSEANELVSQWIVDVYHQRKHSVTHFTPDYLWKEGLLKVEPVLPESTDAFELSTAKPETRALSHDGIQYLHLKYNSDDLQSIRRSPEFHGEVSIRINHENLGFIWVYDPDNDEYIKVACTHLEYADGLTLLQHKKILEDKKEVSNTQYDEEKFLEGKERLRQKIKGLNSDQLLRERKKGARIAMDKAKTELAVSTSEESISPRKTAMNFDLSDIPEFDVQKTGDQ